MYIFSTAKATIVLDDNFKVNDKIDFGKDESLKAAYSLSLQKELESEKKLLEKHKSFVKAAEPRIVYKILEALSETPQSFRELIMLNTKKLISDSVGHDTLIIQAVRTIEDLDKNANGLCKRLREWYSLYLPEASDAIGDNEAFVRVILKKDRKELLSELNVGLSMGKDLADDDLSVILMLAKTIQQLYDQRKNQEEYIEKVMKEDYPNFLAVSGANIGAKMMAQAGGFQRMVMMPASTVQLLGAEEALFRHIKTGAKPPKYGILFQHPIVLKAKKQHKGKAAKTIADKISIAVKVDFFKGDFVGDKLRKDIEKRLKA